MNPVIFFDELDKISDTARGNEITGLLTHLTDNTQNNSFHDKYFSGDGKTETIIKQYKTIQLYVSGMKTVYVKNQDYGQNQKSRAIKKMIPILFNPYGMDEKNSEIYNHVKIIIDDDDKMWANDPITGEKVEIYDDTIVEMSYDIDGEEGFKWKPCRLRVDKTNLYKTLFFL